jgi:hypothetical protein
VVGGEVGDRGVLTEDEEAAIEGVLKGGALGREGDRWREVTYWDLEADLGWLHRDDVAVNCGSPKLEVGLEPGVGTGGLHRRQVVESQF